MEQTSRNGNEYQMHFASGAREKIPMRRSKLHSHRANRTGSHGGIHRRTGKRYAV